MSDIRVKIVNEVVGASEIDRQILREAVLKAETDKLGGSFTQLSFGMGLSRNESAKLSESLRGTGKEAGDTKTVIGALGAVMGTTERETARIGTSIKSMNKDFREAQAVSSALGSTLGISGREFEKVASEAISGSGAIFKTAAAGEALSSTFKALNTNTSGLNQALGGLGGGGGLSSPLAAAASGFGALGRLMGELPLPILIPLLLVAAAGIVTLLVNVWEVVLAFAAMAAALTVAIGLLTVFGAAAVGAFGFLALAIAPIIAIALVLGMLSASQAQASKTAAIGLDTATASYVNAQRALAAANNTTSLTAARNAAGISAGELLVAQQNVAARPTSIGARGALTAAQASNASAQQTLRQQELAHAQALVAAQAELHKATLKLAEAQLAVSRASGVQTSAFQGLQDAMGKMTQTWVAAALPALKQINDWLVTKILPVIKDLGLGVIHWFSEVITPTIKAMQPAFAILVDLLKSGGLIFADFVDRMLQRAPALTEVFKQFGERGLDAFQGLLENGLRLVDWFTSNLPTILPIVNEIFGGIGSAIQSSLDGVANFVTWVRVNWPTIGPVFQETMRALGDFFRDLMKPEGGFARFLLWLEKDFPDAWTRAQAFLNGLGTNISILGGWLDALGGHVHELGSAFDDLGTATHNLAAAFGAKNGLMGMFSQLAGMDLREFINDIETIAWVLNTIAGAVRAIGAAIKSLPGGKGLGDALGGVDLAAIIRFLGNPAGAGLNLGSSITGHAEGGVVQGPGGIDNVLTRLTAGEGVVTTSAMRRLGPSGLAAINSGVGLGAGGGDMSEVIALLRQLVGKAIGTTNVNATAIDYAALARAITKQQAFDAQAGRI